MLTQEVTTKNGVKKTIMAGDAEELAQGVKAAEAEEAEVQPDINDPKDGNKVVSSVGHTDLQGGGTEESEPETEPETEEEQPKAEEAPSEGSEEQTVPQV